MLQQVRLQNFQSHKDTQLEFHKGVNVIIGQSDSGKTAIIRALRWLIWNKPGGDSFRSDWGGSTSVELFTDDDWNVGRVKDKGRNEYTLANTEGRGGLKLYKAFGAGVPDSVTDALNINEVNLQQQLDSHFMLSKSPGEVAAFFNKIAHLDQIDTALKSIASDIRTITTKQKLDSERAEDLTENLTEFDYLDEFEKKLIALEWMEEKWDVSVNLKNTMEYLVSQINEIEIQKEEYDVTLLFKEEVENILESHDKREETWEALETLQEDRAEIHKVGSDIEYNEKLTELLPSVTSVLTKIEERDTADNTWGDMKALTAEINIVELNIVTNTNSMKFLEEVFHDKMPETCPLCGKS